ncbi:MAG: RNA polymerase sigma factor [Terriglobales bacterium]
MSSDASHLRLLVDQLDRDFNDGLTESPVRPTAEPDDETLLVRVQAEDMEALALLFHRYSKLMLGIARRILQDNQEAEDLVQDVFLFLFYKGRTFNPAKGLARSWLMQVTYHRAFDRRRYLNARSFYDRTVEPSEAAATLPPHTGDNPEEFFAWQSALRPAFQSLSDDQQKTLTLHFYEGYTLREISEKLGQSLGTVQHHFYRGIDRLRKHVFHKDRE